MMLVLKEREKRWCFLLLLLWAFFFYYPPVSPSFLMMISFIFISNEKMMKRDGKEEKRKRDEKDRQKYERREVNHMLYIYLHPSHERVNWNAVISFPLILLSKCYFHRSGFLPFRVRRRRIIEHESCRSQNEVQSSGCKIFIRLWERRRVILERVHMKEGERMRIAILLPESRTCNTGIESRNKEKHSLRPVSALVRRSAIAWQPIHSLSNSALHDWIEARGRWGAEWGRVREGKGKPLWKKIDFLLSFPSSLWWSIKTILRCDGPSADSVSKHCKCSLPW